MEKWEKMEVPKYWKYYRKKVTWYVRNVLLKKVELNLNLKKIYYSFSIFSYQKIGKIDKIGHFCEFRKNWFWTQFRSVSCSVGQFYFILGKMKA